MRGPVPVALGTVPTGAETAGRDRGIDALRVGLTVLVVFHHAAITYGAIGGWFYREAAPDGSPSSMLLILFTAVNQAYFMGLFFLLAGFFTPLAIARRGFRGFVRERLIRLGLPILVFGFVIGPATMALAATARGRPFWPGLLRLWSHGTFEIGPLWFAEALLIFAACAILWATRGDGRIPAVRPFPGNASLAAAALATAIVAFSLRLVWPVGTEVLGLQLGYFAGYAVLFGAGAAGASSGWWMRVPAEQARVWLAIAGAAFPVLPAVVLLAPTLGLSEGATNGGWSVQAAAYALWEPLIAWGIILGLLRCAQRFGARLGPAWSRLGRASYGAFILHPPLLVSVGLTCRPLQAPALLKVVLAGSAASILSFAAATLLLQVPALRRVL